MPTPETRFADLVRAFVERSAAPFGEGELGARSKTEVRALAALARSGPMRMGALAGALGIAHSATTALVDRLEAAGLAARERGATDRRVWLVRATDTGARVADAEAAAYRALAANLLAPLSAEERETLAGLLERVVAGLEPR